MQLKHTTSRTLAFLAGLSLAISSTSAVWASENPEADKLFAAAKIHEANAERDRANAAAKLQESNHDELLAKDEQRSASILIARALQMLRADPNRQKAFQLRHESQQLLANAHHRMVVAHNNELHAAQLKRGALELEKAASDVKDQAQVAQQLAAQAKTDVTEAERLDNFAAAEKKAAADEEHHAAELWAESEKLDPDAHKQLGPKPERPVIRQVQDR